MSLTKSEQDDLKMLLNITSSIHNNFIKLLDLERTGQKDSEEYKLLIYSTYSYKNLEDSIFERLYTKDNKQALLTLLLKGEDNTLPNQISTAINNCSDFLIKRRLAIKIESKDKNTNFKEYENVLKKDFINTLLTILNQYLNDPKYKYIINILLQLKYNLAYLYDFVEEDLLKNNFNINPNLYWSSQFHAELKHINQNFIKMASLRMCTKIIDFSFEELLKLNSYSLREVNTYAQAVIFQIILRASLIFVSEDIVDSLKDSVNKQIFANTMMKSDCAAENLILDVINMNKQDRELPNIINLGASL